MINDFEKKEIERFLEDKVMVEAVRKVLFSVMENSLDRFDYNAMNEQLGEKLRAISEARRLLEEGFNKLKSYTKVVILEDNINEAR